MSTIEKAVDKLRRSQDSIGETAARSRGEGNAPGVEEGTSLRDRSDGVMSMLTWNFGLLETAGMLIKDDAKTIVAEEYRQIKRPLLINAFARGGAAVENGNLIMITSALPGEGKTFSTINLAMSIALERDKTVLLVDADVARPAISQYFNEPASVGLVDYLLNEEMTVRDVLRHSDIPNLRVLPAGRQHPHSTELLASARMEQLTRELASRYPDRIILFDSPPLLATTEAAVLAGLMGQIVMVVEAERTQKDVIQEALAQLNQESLVSLVLNKSHKSFGRTYYGYYQYHADNN